MSERWTLLIEDDGPTRVSGDEIEPKTLRVGDAASASRKPTGSSRVGLRTIATRHRHVVLGVVAGATVGVLVASGLSAHRPDSGVHPGVYPVHCAESDPPSKPIARRVDASASKLGGEPRSRSLEEGSLTRRAADLLVANRYDEALDIYRELAEKRPEEVAFLHLASVIEQKLLCDSSQLLAGGACD